jgi:hypothetical protein
LELAERVGARRVSLGLCLMDRLEEWELRVALEHVSTRMRFHDLRHTFGTLAVQAFSLTDVKAFMGHADIQTTMIYAHHVPQHDAADKLTRLLGAPSPDPARRTVDARFENDEDPEEAETLPLQEEDECRRRDSNPRHADYDSAALTD